VTSDEIAALWPHVETVAQAFVARRTLTAAEIRTLLAPQRFHEQRHLRSRLDG
jgi:hypothetical protein